MRNVLTLVTPQELTGRYSSRKLDTALQNFDAVSLPFERNGSSASEFMKRANGLGLAAMGWDWMRGYDKDLVRKVKRETGRTYRDVWAEARMAAEHCVENDLICWFVNSESSFWREENTDERMNEFVTEFYKYCSTAFLVYNGYVFPPKYGLSPLNPETLRRFRFISLMLYGTGRHTIQNKWDAARGNEWFTSKGKRREGYEYTIPHVEAGNWWPMPGVCRFQKFAKIRNKKGEKVEREVNWHWGFYEDGRNNLGLKSLILRDRPPVTCHYMGNGAGSNLLNRTSKNYSTVEFVKKIRSALEGQVQQEIAGLRWGR